MCRNDKEVALMAAIDIAAGYLLWKKNFPLSRGHPIHYFKQLILHRKNILTFSRHSNG